MNWIKSKGGNGNTSIIITGTDEDSNSVSKGTNEIEFNSDNFVIKDNDGTVLIELKNIPQGGGNDSGLTVKNGKLLYNGKELNLIKVKTGDNSDLYANALKFIGDGFSISKNEGNNTINVSYDIPNKGSYITTEGGKTITGDMTFKGNTTFKGIKIENNNDNNYVVLAGGGVKKLSDISGSGNSNRINVWPSDGSDLNNY